LSRVALDKHARTTLVKMARNKVVFFQGLTLGEILTIKWFKISIALEGFAI
jgi:hypothetical protein